jgi:hypothetical protein
VCTPSSFDGTSFFFGKKLAGGEHGGTPKGRVARGRLKNDQGQRFVVVAVFLVMCSVFS